MENLSSENTRKEINQSRVTKTSESGFTVTPFFMISIVFAIIGVGIITFLIYMIPDYPNSSSVDPSTIYDTFFYNVKYVYRSGSSSNYFGRIYAAPGTGYLLLMPIAMLFIAISGLGILLRNRKETKRLIFINWGLYLIPATMAIVKDVISNYYSWNSYFVIFSY